MKKEELLSKFFKAIRSFIFLKSIKIERKISEEGYLENEISVVLIKTADALDEERMDIVFSSAVQIEIGEIDHAVALEVGITDVSDAQMEKIRFRVNERENSMFSFYCNTFEYSVVDN